MDSWPQAKDPDEEYDLQFDWSARLASGETIDTATVTVASGDVTVATASKSGALVTFWVSGGTAGTVSVITCRIITSAGRTYDWSGKLRIRSK